MLQAQWEKKRKKKKDVVISFPLDRYSEMRLLDHMVVLFSFLFTFFLRNFHTIFHSGYTNLHSH